MTRKIALGGIFTAVSIIFLYLAFYLPSMKLSMYFLSGVVAGLMLVETGAGRAWILYGAVSLLSLLVLGNIMNTIPYICIFGLYPLAKYYIEKTRNIYIEIALKLLFLNTALLVVYLLWTGVFMLDIVVPIPVIWLLLGIQVVFLLYDYIFTRIIFYYCDRIRINWRKN